jgi:hypothetical protein
MRKFLIRFTICCLIIGGFITACEFYLYCIKKSYLSQYGAETYRAIEKSKKKKKVKVLVLGDSVARQLYSVWEYNDSIYSLTTNQAATVASVYFLLHNFLQANAGEETLPEKVILLYHPTSFQNDLDQFAFHYFLKPFYTPEYKPLMDDYLIHKIQQIPYYYAAQYPFVKTSNRTPNYRPAKPDFGIFSPLSQIYLEKIVELCHTYNVPFRMIATPVRESLKDELLYQKAHSTHLPRIDNQLLEIYFNSVVFMKDSLFYDRVHFHGGLIPNDYLRLRKPRPAPSNP